ncbi:hypothetical protein CVT25_000431 [Psilocybe cyanescens]|uniref:Uncharacterized protein n=1 Tax=Psilocybe cyanescens TaxID=93625 RepID=A0A409XM67_PSICY|nr:hypothetical protein CVT25_000431 [Psilocybe cyanescens]
MPHQLNHETNGYLAVTFAPTSSFLASPSSLSNTYPGLQYHGQVGELSDVHLYSMSKNIWLSARDNVLGGLQSDADVLHVEEQVPRQRAKRGGDEL